MRSIARLTSVGLLTALVVATFVACKKEKEQNGPSIIIPNEPGIIAGDINLPPSRDTVIRFKILFQKGSGKDDADLKDFSFSFNAGAGNNPVITNRPAPNGTSFTFDTSFSINGTTGQTYTYTFTVRDKNDKSASRSFRITFSQSGGGQPAGAYFSATITLDTASSPFIYLDNNIVARNISRLDDPSRVIGVLLVRRVNHDTNKVSLVSPHLLGQSFYTFPYLNWSDPNKPRTTFYRIDELKYNQATDSASIATVVNQAYQANDTTSFVGNTGGERALLFGIASSSTSGPHQYLAFRQEHPVGNPSTRIWGVIRRVSASSSSSSVTLEIKAIRR